MIGHNDVMKVTNFFYFFYKFESYKPQIDIQVTLAFSAGILMTKNIMRYIHEQSSSDSLHNSLLVIDNYFAVT